MFNGIKNYIGRCLYKLLKPVVPGFRTLENSNINFQSIESYISNSTIGEHAKFYPVYRCADSSIGDYSYITPNSNIFFTEVGKFCSIGPNFISGWGIHPTDGISTHPMFFSTLKQNGMTLSAVDKITERKKIYIGNDVFIGMNVVILDGVRIGDGAVIGAGAVVSKDIPPYAIAVGAPIQIIKYRHAPAIIEKLLEIRWWDWEQDKLKEVEQYFDNVEAFVNKWTNNK